MEAADDICYEIMDIEDAHKLKLLSFEETAELLLGFFDEETKRSIRQRIEDEGVTDKNEQVVYFRACAVGLLEADASMLSSNMNKKYYKEPSKDRLSSISPSFLARLTSIVQKFL